MFKISLDKLFTLYPLIYSSIGFIVINFLINYGFININNIYILLVIYFFGIVSLAYFLLFIIFNVLIPIYQHYKKNKFINNFDYLPSNQQIILWEIYFNNDETKAKMRRNTDLIYLRKNKYIEFITQVSDKEEIYKINKKFISFLDEKLSQQIIENLQSLSNKEEEILNLFYDGNFKEKYDNEDKRALELLINKKIIERQDDKFIVISKYANDLLKNYRNEKIKYLKVELGKYNIDITPDIGGGSRGGCMF